MRPSQDIKPSAMYVKANSAPVLEQVNPSGPMVITQNGERESVHRKCLPLASPTIMRRSVRLGAFLTILTKNARAWWLCRMEGETRGSCCSNACCNENE